MQKLTKNQKRRIRRYSPERYYDYLIGLFICDGDHYSEFVNEIGYSMLHAKRDMTGNFIEYAKEHDTRIGRELEMLVTSIVEKLASGRPLPTSYKNGRKLNYRPKKINDDTNAGSVNK